MSAFYGRQDSSTCGFEEHYKTECSMNGVGDILQFLCNGKTTCELLPWAKLFGSDPCNGTHKYLQVRFLCGGMCLILINFCLLFNPQPTGFLVIVMACGGRASHYFFLSICINYRVLQTLQQYCLC